MAEPSKVEELEHRIVQLYESGDRRWSCLLGFYQSTIRRSGFNLQSLEGRAWRVRGWKTLSVPSCPVLQSSRKCKYIYIWVHICIFVIGTWESSGRRQSKSGGVIHSSLLAAATP